MIRPYNRAKGRRCQLYSRADAVPQGKKPGSRRVGLPGCVAPGPDHRGGREPVVRGSEASEGEDALDLENPFARALGAVDGVEDVLDVGL